MREMLTGRAYGLAAALGLLTVFILGNLALQPQLAGARVDFTERGLYTLTPATRSTLASLAEPVELTLFYSRRIGQDYPRIRAHAARVRELLDAYESASGGRLIVREVDPTPFSEAEDEALAAGMQAVPTQGNDPLYFGLMGRNTVDDTRIISFLAPEQSGTLEYDLTRMIARLDDPEPPRIGLITALQGMQGDGVETGYAVLRDMTRSYTVQRIDAEFASLPEDLDALIIAQAGPFNDYQRWLIDQFVLRTGRLVWIVDPAAKIAGGNTIFDLSSAPQQLEIGPLGAYWGISMPPRAVADAANALPVQTVGPDGRGAIVGQPLFIAAPPANMSRTDPITAELSRAVHLGAPGALELTSASPFTLEPLISTGPAPSFIDAERAAGDMQPAEVIGAYDTLDRPLILAARLTGSPQTAFPGGPPPLERVGDPVTDELRRAEAANALPHIETAEQAATIILIADADFLDDGFYINPAGGAVIADNAAFLMNALDALAGADGLLALRSRAEALRPMRLVDEMRAEAEAEFFDEQARLEDRLYNAQSQLDALEAELSASIAAGGDIEASLTPDERAQLQQLRQDILDTRARLRAIERDFRRDIDGLEGILKAVNIWGGAALVILLGLLLYWRSARRRA